MMEHISEQEWQNLTNLSKLYVTEEEAKEWKNDVGQILSYVGRMMQLCADAPMTCVKTNEKNVVRDDCITNTNGQEDTLRNAPDCRQNMFLVPDSCGRSSS